MDTIHIVGLLTFVIHVSPSIDIDFCVEQDIGWTEVKGMEPYELLLGALSILIELLLNVCITITKLFILACIITTCIDIFIEILVIYVIQFSSEVLKMLIQE